MVRLWLETGWGLVLSGFLLWSSVFAGGGRLEHGFCVGNTHADDGNRGAADALGKIRVNGGSARRWLFHQRLILG